MMTRMALFFAALWLAVAAPVVACAETADENAAPAPRPAAVKKVFTNDTLEELRRKWGELAAGEVPPAEPAAPVEVESAAARDKLARYVKEKDPAWYRAQLDALRGEVERVSSRISGLRDFRKTGQGSMSGLALDQANLRLTPENELEQSSLRRRELQRQIEDFEDAARRNEILPGRLRAAPAQEMAGPPWRAATRLTLADSEVGELENERAEAESRLAAERARLERMKTELALDEREWALGREQFYSNAAYALDSKGRAQLAALAGQISAWQQEIRSTEEKIAAVEEDHATLDRALGPRPAAALTPEQQGEWWQDRLRPHREELARVDGDLERMRREAASRRMTLFPETTGGSPTSILLRRLETRAGALRREIESIADQARLAGVPPGWLQ